MIGDHGLRAGLPLGRANLTVFIGELEGLDETDVLVDVSTNGEIIDRQMSDDTQRVDDESASVGSSLSITFCDEHTVVRGDLLGDVSEEGDLHSAESTILAGLLAPF